MRKILSFVAAMLIAFAANATTWNITPTHCHEGDRTDGYTLYVTLARGAQAGDTIVLADGTYLEGQSMPINNAVVIKAAEGANPVIQMSGYFQVHASAEFEGLKFKFVGEASNGYCMYFYENTSKYLKLEGCEFQDFTQYCVSSWEDYHIDSCIVNNCYFHDLAKAPFYFAASSLENNVNACDKLKVTNSTFANIAVVGYVAVLDIRNNSGNVTGATSKLEVDHCTFYNCQGDYERMIQSYKSPDATVSNCIMMNPIVEGKTEIYATYLYGGSIHHNLNYQTKRQYGSGVTVTDSIQRDPLFVNAASLDLHLGDGSPALGAGSDGSNLGDPRWWPAPIVGVPEFYLVGSMNGWAPAEAYKFAANPEADGEYMLTTTLAVGDSIKVAKVVGNTTTYYPDGMDNHYTVDAAHAGEKTIYFQETYKADWAAFGGHIYIEANPAPQPIDPTAPYVLKFNGTGSSSDSSNDYKKDGDIFTDACKMYVASVDTISKVYAARIIEGDTSSLKFGTSSVKGYMEFTLAIPTAVDSIVVDATQYGNNATKIAVNGEEFTVNAGNKKAYLCKITPAGIITKITIAQTSSERLYLRSIAVYPKSGDTPEPEVNYLLKNNWNGGEWTWKEMTKDGDTYKLDSVVFGGTGVNYKSDLLGAPELWVPMADFLGDTIAALDTVNFVLNPADSTITATLLGKYIAPVVELNYLLKNNWDAAADWTWKEMTKDGDNYKLENVVFGGTGVNYKSNLLGAPELWVPMADFLGDTIAAKDTVTFVLNPADSTITVTLLGKYVEPAPEPMANPIYKVDFFNRDWSKDSLSTVAWDAENQKVVIDIIPGKSDTWQGQLWLKLPMQVKAGKEYDLSFKATADKTFGGIVVKYQQNAEMTIIYDFALTAGQESVYSKENLRGVNGGDSVLCISFGFAPDSTHIELYDIAIVEHEPTTPPAKFFVTGNDAFTVDAGLTTAKSWNPDAFKSETDTIIFNLKAGAEYQIKVCVDGTWNTAKNYNDLTEKAPGLIDADGNNHNIGFSLAADGPVKVIYTADVFKLEGNFYVAPKLTTCAEIYDMAKNDEVALNPVTVTYVNGKNIYVMDATAGMLIYLPKNGSWKIGDKLSGVEGKVDIYNGIYEVKMDSAQVAAVVADSGAAPKPVKVDSITLKDMSKYILVQNIQFADTAKFAEGTASNINIVVAGDTIVLRNNFKNGYTFEPGKKYDIAALVTLYSNKIQLYFVDASEHLDITYYLAGTMNEWKANEAYKFAVNPADEDEYMLTTALAVGDKFKVIGVVGTDISWFPTGVGNDYVVDSLHAGEAKNIYFRPEGGQEGWYEGFFFVEENEETMDSIPTTAPAAPTAAEDDVLAIYCNHYTTNNLNFAISGWAGGYETLTIDSTKIGFWTNMTWECIIDPAPNTDNAHDFSAYKKLHVDFWAPKSAKIKFTVEAVAGGNYKDGQVVNLVKGWNCCDFVVAEWPDNYDFTNVKCFVLEQYQTPAGESFEGNPFAFANIYFYEKESQALDNTSDGVKAVKYIRNGMLLIEKNGKVYTITGQVVR